MKFDTAYSLNLDEKLSIYDVRELNFDETAAYDSDKDHFLCPNDACRAAFEAGNTLSTFNAKNVNYRRTPHFKNKSGTRHIDGCRYASSHKGAAGESDDDREDHFPSEFVLTRRTYPRKTPLAGAEGQPHKTCRKYLQPAQMHLSAPVTPPRIKPAYSPTRWNAMCRISTTRTSSKPCP
jgi:hypothetical protein